MSALSRRAALTGAAALTATATAVLTGCARYGESGLAGAPAVAGAQLAAVADVPVGGGVVLADQQVVLTRPSAGDLRAFSTVCTHQGCAVTTVADGTIDCPCHGSRFSIVDGAPVAGPAQRPLDARAVTVDGAVVRSA